VGKVILLIILLLVMRRLIHHGLRDLFLLVELMLVLLMLLQLRWLRASGNCSLAFVEHCLQIWGVFPTMSGCSHLLEIVF
jgi:hypothetical protein